MNQNGAKLRVHFGCGFTAPETWLNFDASPTLRVERLPLVGGLYTRNEKRFPPNVKYGDIVKGLPLAPKSCVVVYASHVLEHLALTEFQTALKHTYELLVGGGIFRLVVPDLETFAKRYVESVEETAAHAFMKGTSLGTEQRNRGVGGLLRSWLGNSSHLWMWDFKSLEHELRAAGFIDIERCSFGDNPLFIDVEEASRFVDALAIQCARP